MDQSQMSVVAMVVFGTSLFFTRDITKSFLITAAYGFSSFVLIEDSKNKPIPAIQNIKMKTNTPARPPGPAIVQNPPIVQFKT